MMLFYFICYLVIIAIVFKIIIGKYPDDLD